MSDRVHKANPEKSRENAARWRKANPEKHAEWGKKNPEARRASKRRFAEKHPEYRREFYVANSDAIKERVRKWCLENPEQHLATRRAYRARKAKAEGTHTGAEILALLERQNGRCAYCAAPIRRKRYHADHIVPLFLGGSNWISNIQLTCSSCNQRKSALDPAIFARRLGMLI
jgi:5-methylcytosine-specific restriction endonuclease McrA